MNYIRKRSIWLFFLLFIGGLVGLGGVYFLEDLITTYHIKQINDVCPLLINSKTQLNMIRLKDDSLHLNYSLIDHKDVFEKDLNDIEYSFRLMLVDWLTSNDRLIKLLKTNLVTIHNLKSFRGDKLISVKMAPGTKFKFI